MAGHLQRDQVPTREHKRLPPEVREYIAHAKNYLRNNPGLPGKIDKGQRKVVPGKNVVHVKSGPIENNFRLEPFDNERGEDGDGAPLPKNKAGHRYFKFQVGRPHKDDPKRKGKRRLVLEIHLNTNTIADACYTDRHYAKGSFVRIQN